MIDSAAIKLAALATLVLALIGAGAFVAHQQSRIAELSAQLAESQAAVSVLTDARARDKAALARYTAANTRIRKESRELEQALTAALNNNREWADTPVPEDVQNALRRPDTTAPDSGVRQ